MMADVTIVEDGKEILYASLLSVPQHGDYMNILDNSYKVKYTEFVYDSNSDEFETRTNVYLCKGSVMNRPNPILGKR